MKKLNTTKLMALAALSVLQLVLLLFGVGIMALGVPGVGGILNTVVYSSVIIFTLLVIDYPYAATILFTIFGFLSLPFPLMGTSGLLVKIPIGIVAGLVSDCLYALLKKNKLVCSLAIGGVVTYYIAVVLILVSFFVRIPGLMTFKTILSFTAFVSTMIVGAIGGAFGLFVYNKIKCSSVVRRIQK